MRRFEKKYVVVSWKKVRALPPDEERDVRALIDSLKQHNIFMNNVAFELFLRREIEIKAKAAKLPPEETPTETPTESTKESDSQEFV